jgi:hypothetical protein
MFLSLLRRSPWLLLAASPLATAAPAHYVVFTLDANDRAEPVFYAQVELAGTARTDLPARTAQAAGLAWQPLKNGVAGTPVALDVPRALRVEFDEHGDPDPREAPNPERAFVLRVPLAAADAVEIVGGARTTRIDLAELAARAPTLKLASMPLAQATLARGSVANHAENRLDVLVLGDGYTSAQQSTFDTHAAALRTAMFNVTPYKEYANFVNWQPAFVASAQSGADHPPYQAGCTTSSCCADTAAQSDPRANTFVDTAFDAHFCTAQVHRSLYASSTKVYAAAAGVPDWDTILVTVNDPVYGGAGGSFAVQSAHAQAPRIVIHEFGHTFSDLADEYTSPYPGFPPCSDTGASPNCEANVTNQTNASLVKWRERFAPGVTIPTPAGTSGIGLFTGARYLTSGMYRPTDTQCLMRALGTTFCDVCKQEYVLKLYRGGFGVPADGIDLIEPDTEYPSTATPVDVAIGTSRTFGATLLRPVIGTVEVTWRLDGTPVSGASMETYTFSQNTPTPATRTLELVVVDRTPMVLASAAGNLLTHTRTWTIAVGNDRLFKDGFD